MRQQGAVVLLLMLIIMVVAATYYLTGSMSSTGQKIANDKKTAAALAQAKDALIGRALADLNRPGSLPCPDTSDDGVAPIFSGNNCPAYIGRLPWKTLDLPDLRDASGERLWYALSSNFRDNQSAEPINSDTKGTLTIYAPDGSTSLTPPGSEAVAVVFSPGSALGSQIRSSATASCPALGKNVARQLCPDNYLDQMNCPGANCRNNATGPFVVGPVLDANGRTIVNDRLLVIRARDIMPTVEKRVAKELKGWLQSYYETNHYYPYPARYDHEHCKKNNCSGDAATCRGRIPSSEASGNEPWTPPDWFVNNQWYREIYYSVGDGYLQYPTGSCGTNLSVSGVSVGAVFFTPGTPIGNIFRPSDYLSDYLEDPENQDGWGIGANDIYVTPTSRLNDRDRVYTLP